MPVILTLWRLSQEDAELEASLRYIARFCVKAIRPLLPRKDVKIISVRAQQK